MLCFAAVFRAAHQGPLHKLGKAIGCVYGREQTGEIHFTPKILGFEAVTKGRGGCIWCGFHYSE